MPCVYRYTDKTDNIIKYVGIVWSDRRSLDQRIKEHSKEKKFQGHNWEIEYIDCDGRSRTDTEYLEAHYISLYKTYKYLNSGKSNWGVSKIISDNENTWVKWEPKRNSLAKRSQPVEANICEVDNPPKILFGAEQDFNNDLMKINRCILSGDYSYDEDNIYFWQHVDWVTFGILRQMIQKGFLIIDDVTPDMLKTVCTAKGFSMPKELFGLFCDSQVVLQIIKAQHEMIFNKAEVGKNGTQAIHVHYTDPKPKAPMLPNHAKRFNLTYAMVKNRRILPVPQTELYYFDSSHNVCSVRGYLCFAPYSKHEACFATNDLDFDCESVSGLFESCEPKLDVNGNPIYDWQVTKSCKGISNCILALVGETA